MAAGVAELRQVSGGQSDHGLLSGLSDDDHAQYLLLAGRAGGQSAIGGTAVSEELNLRGTTNANLGLIRFSSPIVFNDVTAANALQPYSVQDASTNSFTAGFIGGTYADKRTVDFTNALFVYEVLAGSPVITKSVDDGFSAFTLFNGLPVLKSGTGATHNPLSALVLNAGPNIQHLNTGTRTTANVIGLSFSPQLNTRASNAQTLNVTSVSAATCAPKFNTNAGTTVNFGTIRGLHCQLPAVALFGSAAGVETMTAYIGLDWENMAGFGGNVTKAAVRSTQAAASNAYFLLHTGTAKSYFSGPLHLRASNVGIHFGAADSVQINWNGTALEWDPATGLDARWRPFTNYWHYTASAVSGLQFDVNAISFGTTAPDLTGNWFTIFAAPNLRTVNVGGQYADVLWTAGGTIDVNGQAVSDLSAFQINAVSTLLSGGSIADSSTLFINAMASVNATRLQALRVLGRTRLDGLMTHNEATLAQLTADVAALALPANNGGRFVLLMDADALGPWTVQGIVNVQVGDSVYIINNGANAWDFGHEDAGAAAADRIITPTAATWTLGPREFAKLWYDPVATRWRILESNGA